VGKKRKQKHCVRGAGLNIAKRKEDIAKIKREISEMTTVAVSGGFDPLHKGHVRLIRAAATYGDVIVILNSDEWLQRKKAYKFMDWDSRAEIINSIKGVVLVISVDDTDGTVCEALKRIKPDYFANGGDRFPDNTPELKVCLDLGIKPLFNVGGEKVASSSELVAHAVR